jgi:2-keto-4-pentenoate hydratase
MVENQLIEIGTRLYERFRNKVPFSFVSVDNHDLNIQDAYQIQKTYTNLRSSTEGGFAGYKIAYSTKVMQDRIGAKEPVYGRIFSDGVLTSPTSLAKSNFVRLGIECEVAIRIGRNLDGSNRGPFTREEVLDAIESLSIAFEIIDSRSSLTTTSLLQQTLVGPGWCWRTL